VVWQQTSVEASLLDEQVYRDATDRLDAARKDPDWDALPRDERTAPVKGLPPAVVLDVDETVLDNSTYQARLIRDDREYDDASWGAWANEEAARAIPGALAFTRSAAKRGIRVVYLSNRAQDLGDATLDNLRKLGFPVADRDAFLGLGTYVAGCEQNGSEKSCRRRLVGRKYRVLMQFGDQIGDFVEIVANTPNGRIDAMKPYADWIGERWFVLPNATYGSWEPALFNNDWTLPANARRQQKINALRMH
jgi:acid phosphatase